MNVTFALRPAADPASTRPPMRALHHTQVIPLAVLVAMLTVIYAGFLLFPVIKQVMNQQDCIASGRIDCVARP